jgi:type I restriction enzyme S subunit
MSISIVSLGEIVDFVRGVTFDKSQQQTVGSSYNIPVLRAGNIQTRLDIRNDLIFVPRDVVSEVQLLRKGDIAICLSSGSPQVVGKTAQLDVDWRGTVGGFCGIIRPKKADPDFLALWLRGPQYLAWRDEQARGANIQNLRFSELSDLEIQLPTPSEQRRIAACLKAQLAEVETARQAAQAQLREVSNLANAIIFDSIGSHPTESHSLGDVLDEVKQGIGPAWAEYPVLGATRDGLAPAKEQPGKQAPKYKPAFPGTVFYNPMRILIGSIAFVDEDDTPGITSPDYVVLQGKPGKVDSRWFYYWLRSPLGAQCITSLARGAVRERMLFNRLAEGEIVLPDFAVQEKASLALKELKPLRRAIENQLAEIDLFPQKILAQAFEYQGD